MNPTKSATIPCSPLTFEDAVSSPLYSHPHSPYLSLGAYSINPSSLPPIHSLTHLALLLNNEVLFVLKVCNELILRNKRLVVFKKFISLTHLKKKTKKNKTNISSPATSYIKLFESYRISNKRGNEGSINRGDGGIKSSFDGSTFHGGRSLSCWFSCCCVHLNKIMNKDEQR